MENGGSCYAATLSPNPIASTKDKMKNTMCNSFPYPFMHKDDDNDEDLWFDDTKPIKFDEDIWIDDTITIEFNLFNDNDIL